MKCYVHDHPVGFQLLNLYNLLQDKWILLGLLYAWLPCCVRDETGC